MASTHDLPSVTRHGDHLLRQFVAARQGGDEAAMRQAWRELVGMQLPRVRNIVGAYRFHPLADEEDAVTTALTKMLTNMILTFRGTSMGELVNATVTLTQFACIDVDRRAKREGEKRALIHAGGDEPDHEAFDRRTYEVLAGRAAEEDDREHEAELYAQGAAFLDHAIPRLSGHRRAVLEGDRQGLTTEQIRERLGVSADVVYQSRRRGTQDLHRMRVELGR